ncbi:uncharacterized protein F5891DRAFT_984534 [Suillus fuscotomentosus]|uniref:Uncharacterized protein n=1 Tax=Suillus fuscotomentosus TaxID=1912939 RepID=A0AAD4HGX7_9AGAM|nr:uncharacterized protein F5891DRAFT_984534 [Suillus fuscotomentosus]KAG1895079.1 hypothetical protein F5891DRAFT_984534 [Suillus fuscotomentosus]
MNTGQNKHIYLEVPTFLGTDCRKIHSNDRLVDRGTQTAVEIAGTSSTRLGDFHRVMNDRSIGEVESELDQVKQKLRTTEDTVAYLSDKVGTYRRRWLEEYYRAENLKHHMPCEVCIPDLPQIAEGIPSPGFSPEFLEWEEQNYGEHT